MPKLYTLNFKTIKSTLFWLDNNYTMNLVIHHDKDKPIIQSYGSSWFITPRYYIEITSLYKNAKGVKNRFIINNQNMFQFKIALKNIGLLITGKESVFYKDSNGNIRLDKSRTKPITVRGGWGSKINMVLGIHSGQKNGDEQYPCVFFIINDSEDFIMMDLGTFMNFKMMIEGLDVYNAVMNTLLYVGRFEERELENIDTEYVNNKKNGGSGNKDGFFNRVGAMKRDNNGDGKNDE